MPRLVPYSVNGRFDHWFAPWEYDEEPTPMERDHFAWMEWPFTSTGGGCLACAWAHWWGYAYFDNCAGIEVGRTDGQQSHPWETVNPRCGYLRLYEEWCNGEIPFNPDMPWLARTRDDQRREVDRRENNQYPEGCRACARYQQDSGEWDPCDWGDPNSVNGSCAYAEWYTDLYDPETRRRRQERARRRRGDGYPEEYRSRRGRGTCTLRREAAMCPPNCPCRGRRRRREEAPAETTGTAWNTPTEWDGIFFTSVTTDQVRDASARLREQVNAYTATYMPWRLTDDMAVPVEENGIRIEWNYDEEVSDGEQ